MEAAALYAFAQAASKQVLCLAHVTNTMGQAGQDFEKAKYYPEDTQFLLEFEENVQHYEVFATI